MSDSMKRIPFIPMKPESVKRVSRRFMGIGEDVAGFFPSLDFVLDRSGLGFEPREWTGVCVFSSIFYAAMVSGLLLFISMLAKINPITGSALSILSGFMMGGATFMYLMFYPKLIGRKKTKELETNLSYALHHLLIHVRSGVPLFNSMISIAKGGYGTLSKEFEKAVKEIDTGKSEIEALESLARDNPSMHFRRIMWQMVNAMKSGSDIGRTLSEIVDSISVEQRIAIKKYGSELNPLALFYMLLVVIFPTLGIIFILVLFSFIGSMINMEVLLMGILMMLLVVQVMFIGMIKTKRPMGV